MGIPQIAPTGESLADALQHRAGFATSVEGFGESIVRASLLEAAKLVREGKGVNGRVEFPAKVFVRFYVDPKSLDLKFEECMSVGTQTALQCYSEHAPTMPEVKFR